MCWENYSAQGCSASYTHLFVVMCMGSVINLRKVKEVLQMRLPERKYVLIIGGLVIGCVISFDIAVELLPAIAL